MTSKIPLTIVIPVWNEEANLGACLSHLCEFQEVLVVDSGSTDRTVELASAYGAKVMQFRWEGGFPKKRNWVLQTHEFHTDWVLFLDADEEVTNEFRSELKEQLDKTT